MAIKENRLPDEHDYVPEESKKKDKKKEEGNFFQRTGKSIVQWFKDMRGELKKVIWPTKTQIINNCAVVLVVVIVSAVVIWGFDEIALFCVDAIISLRG
jgi:preprotein translocase subunit SecE